jgi:hypothetical protein
MPADLKSKSSLQRSSVILAADSVIKLEHAYTQDRVYRCNYDRIQSILIWSRVPTGRLVLAALLILLAGVGLLIAFTSGDVGAEITAGIFGGALLIFGIVLVYRYTVHKYTTIRITRGGAPLDIEGIYPRRKLARFRDDLLARVRASQPAPSTQTIVETESNAAVPLPDLPPQEIVQRPG